MNKKIKELEELKVQMKEDEKSSYRNALREKLKEKMENQQLPKFARVNDKSNIQCMICGFLSRDVINFNSHVSGARHTKAETELIRKKQEEAKAAAEKGVNFGKRKSEYNLEFSVEEVRIKEINGNGDDENDNDEEDSNEGAEGLPEEAQTNEKMPKYDLIVEESYREIEEEEPNAQNEDQNKNEELSKNEQSQAGQNKAEEAPDNGPDIDKMLELEEELDQKETLSRLEQLKSKLKSKKKQAEHNTEGNDDNEMRNESKPQETKSWRKRGLF